MIDSHAPHTTGHSDVTPAPVDPLTSYVRGLSTRERAMLVGLSGVAAATLERIRTGKPVRPVSRERVALAVRSLQARSGGAS